MVLNDNSSCLLLMISSCSREKNSIFVFVCVVYFNRVQKLSNDNTVDLLYRTKERLSTQINTWPWTVLWSSPYCSEPSPTPVSWPPEFKLGNRPKFQSPSHPEVARNQNTTKVTAHSSATTLWQTWQRCMLECMSHDTRHTSVPHWRQTLGIHEGRSEEAINVSSL